LLRGLIRRRGKVQVELAQLKYLLPRLAKKTLALSRLTGGIGVGGRRDEIGDRSPEGERSDPSSGTRTEETGDEEKAEESTTFQDGDPRPFYHRIYERGEVDPFQLLTKKRG